MLINKSQLKQRCQQFRNFSENADSMSYVLLEIFVWVLHESRTCDFAEHCRSDLKNKKS